MRKFTKTMAAVLSLTMTLTMVTPVFAEGETNITPAQTTEVVTPTPTATLQMNTMIGCRRSIFLWMKRLHWLL